MTLDQRVFTREMTILHKRFGRDPDADIIGRYFDTLQDQLTTEEFAAAARHVFDHDAFWPTPMRFVELAGGTAAVMAQREWRMLVEAAQNGRRLVLSPEGEAALRAAGGWHEVAYADTDRKLPRLERAFVRAYEADAGSDRALPAPPSIDLEVVP